mgnify:FL=1
MVAGLIVDVRSIKTQRGVMAVLKLDDGSGQIEATVFADLFAEHRDLLSKDRIVLIEGRLQPDDYSGGLSLRSKAVRSLEEMRSSRVSELLLRVDGGNWRKGLNRALHDTLAPARGGACPVIIDYTQAAGSIRLRMGEEWRVNPSDALLDSLRGVVGSEHVELVYAN